MFAKETYTTRRNSLKKRGDRFLAILDNEESGDYADNTYHFRQGSIVSSNSGSKDPASLNNLRLT